MSYNYENGYDENVEPKHYGFTPTCRFCGQTQMQGPYDSQEQANESATMNCDCPDAKAYQAEQERKQKREENIVKLKSRLGELQGYCERRQVDFNGDRYDTLLKIGIDVLDGIIDSATLKFARMKVSVGINNKSNLVIKFTYSDGASLEV